MAAILAASTVAQAQDNDVKLGLLLAYTGPLETVTPGLSDAAELAVAQVNAQGGILGGRTLSLFAADGACDTTTAANAADRLVNTDQVTAIVGGMCTGETIAGANNAGIPGNVVMISPSSTAPTVTDLDDNDLVFRTAPSDAYQGDVLARLLLSKGIDEVVLTYVNNDYGNGFADAFSTAFIAGGGDIAATASHEEGRADYRPELGNLAATGVETLVILAYGDGSGQTILRQAIESGNFLSFVGGDGMVGDYFDGMPAAAIEGMIGTKPADSTVEGAAIFAGLAEDAGIDGGAIFGPQTYDAAFLLALAIEQNGTDDREGLSDALRSVSTAPGEVILPGEWAKAVEFIAAGEDIDYQGAAGLHEFDGAGDVPGAIVEMTVQNGVFVEVGPAE